MVLIIIRFNLKCIIRYKLSKIQNLHESCHHKGKIYIIFMKLLNRGDLSRIKGSILINLKIRNNIPKIKTRSTI